MASRQRAATCPRIVIAVMDAPVSTATDDDGPWVYIPRDVLLRRALDLARHGSAEFAVWFATMVGDPRYDEFPLHLPESLAKELGLT